MAGKRAIVISQAGSEQIGGNVVTQIYDPFPII